MNQILYNYDLIFFHFIIILDQFNLIIYQMLFQFYVIILYHPYIL